eukprot:4432232-Pyramimonas_sp.AAC.1
MSSTSERVCDFRGRLLGPSPPRLGAALIWAVDSGDACRRRCRLSISRSPAGPAVVRCSLSSSSSSSSSVGRSVGDAVRPRPRSGVAVAV